MTTLARMAALWVGAQEWYLSGTATDPRQDYPEVEHQLWRTAPTWSNPARLVSWSEQVARGSQHAMQQKLGQHIKMSRPQDTDGVLRYALIIGPDAGGLLSAAKPKPLEPHPWRHLLEEQGWKVRTRDPDKEHPQAGVWLTIERPGSIEIGILMAGWCDPTKAEELATHGLVLTEDTRLDPWGTCYLHGDYRRLTTWPLSAGAGMAAIKGLKRFQRDAPVIWSPPPEDWQATAVMQLGRPAARPWHQQWTTPEPHAAGPDGPIALWDANADYLTSWTSARFSREPLTHTGPNPPRTDADKARTGWHLITITWQSAALRVVDQLPPVWGSRTPDKAMRVWVTHEILDLLDTLAYPGQDGEPRRAATYQVHDSYTCQSGGQVARPWGDRLKAALLEAKREQEHRPDGCTITLVKALKASYSRGYPLLETSGLIRHPVWVDTIVDRRGASAYRRMWAVAWIQGRFPLQVSADEILYPWRAGDDERGPLGETSDYAYGAYKVKRRGTLSSWQKALLDGRGGRWWNPAPALSPLTEPAVSQALRTAPDRPVQPRTPSDRPGDWVSHIRSE